MYKTPQIQNSLKENCPYSIIMYVLHISSSSSSLRSCHNNQSDYSATVKCYLCTAMPSAIMPSPYQTVHMGSVACAVILVHALRTKLGQALISLRKSWLRRTGERSFTLSHPGVEPLATRFTVQNVSQAAETSR